MSTSAQLAKQNLNFAIALSKGQITQAQYDQAMGYQSQQANVLPKPTYTPSQTQTPSAPVTVPLPPNPSTHSPVIQDQQTTWIQQGSTVTPITQPNPENPSAPPTIIGYNVTPPPSPPPQVKQPEMIEPTLQNILTNPVGVAGTLTQVYGHVFNKLPEGPLKETSNFFVGAAGEVTNQGTQIENALGGLVGKEQKPLPFTPQNKTQQLGMTAERVGEAASIAVVAPVVAPAIGIGAGAVIAGEVISVGINEGMSFIQTGKFLSPEQVVVSAAEGGVFTIIGGKAIQLAGLAGKAGLAATGGRIGINTGLGAGFGTGSEYVETGKVTGQGTLQGLAFGAAFGLAGEAGGRIQTRFNETPLAQKINAKIGNIQERIFGGKATEVIGANEIRNEVTTGKTTKVSQLTEPVTREVNLRGKELAYYKQNNLSTLREPTIKLAGTEKVYQPDLVTGGKKLEPIPTLRQVESTRNAEPFLAALKQEKTYRLASVKKGNINDFIESPTNAPAIRKSVVTIDSTKGQPTAVLAKKTIVTSKGALLPENRFIAREFTGVKITGKVDPQVYANAAKAVPDPIAQDIYKKLGGGYKQMIDFGTQQPKDLHGPMKPFTETQKSPTTKYYDTASSKNTSPLTTTTETAKPTTVTLNRAIVNVKSAKPISTTRISMNAPVNPFIQTKQNQQLEEETTYYSTPNAGLKHPQQPSFMTQTNQRQTAVLNQQQSPANPLSQNNQQLSSSNVFINQHEKAEYTPTQAISQPQIFKLSNVPTVKATSAITPIVIPKTTPKTPEGYGRSTPALSLPFTFPGSKAMEFGGNAGSYPNFTGLRSVKRQYDILTAEEFMGY